MTETTSPRVCFTVLVDQFNEHGYIPSVVTEGESGHRPMIGSGDFAEPWYWGTDFEGAKQIAAHANAGLGLTDDDVFEIIASSMRVGNEAAARLDELGLTEHFDRINQTQARLIREGKIT